MPVITYFWLIRHYGVNAIWYDQWDNIRTVSDPSLGNLWAPDNENRIFFPNLVAVLLAHVDHLNVVHEEFLGATLLVAATAFFVFAHKRRAPSTPWLLYCPVVIVMFYFGQTSNTLYGFQLSWFMVLVSLAGALFLLDVHDLDWWLGAAIACGIIGTFSSLEGLFIWPTGLVLLWIRRKPRTVFLVWIGSGVASGALYFYNYHPYVAGANNSYVLTHPVAGVEFFFSAVGDVLGEALPFVGHNVPVLVFGVALFVLAVWVLVFYGFGRSSSGSAIGQALIIFGLLFALSVTIARTAFGLYAAGGSRYTTFDLLIPIGCYMTLLERPRGRISRQRGFVIGTRAAAVSALVIIVALGTRNGINEAREWHTLMAKAATVTIHIDHASNNEVEAALYPSPWVDIPFIRHEARIARQRDLSSYAS